MWSAYPLHLPKLSYQLCQELLSFAKTFILNQAYDPNQEMSDQDWAAFYEFHKQTNSTTSTYKTFQLPFELQQKIKNELADQVFPFDKFDIGVQYITSGDRLVTHRDAGRTLNLIYNLTGDNSITEFYNKKIQDEHRYVFHLEELEGPTEVHCFEKDQWVVFNNQQVHSVINNNKSRIALTVNIDATFDQFIDYFSSKNLIDLTYKPL
jgi:hypothetical protein